MNRRPHLVLVVMMLAVLAAVFQVPVDEPVLMAAAQQPAQAAAVSAP
jgi:hypothetical protein